MNEQDENNSKNEHATYRLRIPGFITDKDVGLGDVVKRVTYAVGMKPCGGCEQRAATLNSWLTLSPRRGR
jgi:hypothetical protein